jgi:excisionase family DNA binding protein
MFLHITDSDLTPNQAASHLNVSRPYLLGLLKQGEIPFHYVGTHRRIRLRDIVAYREKVDEESEKALLELAAQAQELRMGYPG